MMKLHRFALFAGLMAFGLAACGDDVQVVDPPPTPPPPLVVTMSPQNQQIEVGQTADFTVNISGGAEGVDAEWECVSGNTTYTGTAQVTATGCRVTGVAPGSTTVTAEVTKGTQSASAGGQITVSLIPVEPSVISISSLEQGGTSAITSAIRGQLSVGLNVTANDETPTRVTVFLSDREVASQTISAGAFDEAEEGPDGQFSVPIELTFPTDRYDGMFLGDAVTGEAWHLNGTHVIQAQLTVAERPDEPSASNAIELQLLNFNRIHVSEIGSEAHQTKLPTNSALSAALPTPGALWYGGPGSGPVQFRAVPVIYQTAVPGGSTPRTIEAPGGALNVGLGACANDPAAPFGAGPFDFTFACAGVEAAGNGPGIVGTPLDSEGNPIVFGGATLTPFPNAVPAIVGPHPFPINIDFLAPTGAALSFVSGNGNRENWGNEDYGIASGYIVPADGGVGIPAGAPANGMERRFRVRMGSTVVHTFDYGNFPELGDVEAAQPATFVPSINNSAYNFQVQPTDRLGNVPLVGGVAAWIAQSIATAATPPAFIAQCGAAPCQLAASNATSNNIATFGYDPDDPTGARTTIGGAALPDALQAVFDVPPAGTNFEFSSTDILSGFAAPAVPAGSLALFDNHVSVIGTQLSPMLTTAILGGAGTAPITATPFADTDGVGDPDAFVATPRNSAAYAQTPTSISTAPASVVIAAIASGAAQYEIYQARSRDKAGNLSPLVSWQVYVNNGTAPIFTGLIAQGTFIGGQQALFPGTAQDGLWPPPGIEIYQGSFDLQYPVQGHLVYERPNPDVDDIFDDNIAVPANVNFMTGATGTPTAFIRALQPTTVDGGVPEPVTGHAPVAGQVKPNLMTGRVYNGTLEGLPAAPLYPCHIPGVATIRPCHTTDGAPAAAPAVGASGHAIAPILSTQVENGTDFTTAAPAVAIGNFYISAHTVSISSGTAPAVKTATVTIRARGPTTTFVNPFPGGLVLVENIGGGPMGPYLRPITGVLTPPANLPLPTLDNGVIRDFDWTFTFTLPTLAAGEGINVDGARVIQAVGLSSGFDGLVSRPVSIPWTAPASSASTTAGTVVFLP